MQHTFKVGDIVTRHGDDRCEVVALISDDALSVICRVAGEYLQAGQEYAHMADRFALAAIRDAAP